MVFCFLKSALEGYSCTILHTKIYCVWHGSFLLILVVPTRTLPCLLSIDIEVDSYVICSFKQSMIIK